MNIVDEMNIDECLNALRNAEKCESRETLHSKLLAYFLKHEPNFLRKILEKVGATISDLSNLTVYTEKENIDILVENKEFVLAIENKYKDRNRNNQLNRYENYVDETYSNVNVKKFLYLKPFMHKLSKENNNWNQLLYCEISDIIKSIDCSSSLKQYNEIIEKIYEPQKLFIECLNEIVNTNNIEIDNTREDINGFSIKANLNNNNYTACIEIENSDALEKRGNVVLCLTFEKEKINTNDKELINKIKKENFRLMEDELYIYFSQEIYKNDFDKETLKKAVVSSELLNVIKTCIAV